MKNTINSTFPVFKLSDGYKKAGFEQQSFEETAKASMQSSIHFKDLTGEEQLMLNFKQVKLSMNGILYGKDDSGDFASIASIPEQQVQQTLNSFILSSDKKDHETK